MTREYADLVGLGVQHRLVQIGRELERLRVLVTDLLVTVRKEEARATPASRRAWTPERRKKFLATMKKKKRKKGAGA